ncbi:MAG: amidohydrolase [Aestuariivita sp.]|nr:amidohydrolase [Aestuariivita sp.]
MSLATVFAAKKIITMDRNCPVATHVAVRDGKILAVGGRECADPWGHVVHDNCLADTVLMPGLVEGHAHMMAGAIWDFAYVGFHDRIDPQGRHHEGRTDLEAVIRKLEDRVATLEAGQPLVAWGFDPIFLPSERLHRRHLDRIASDRPIVVLFSNLHLMCVNSHTLNIVEYTRETSVKGVVKDADGEPTGELQEMTAMFPVMWRTDIDFRALAQNAAAIEAYAAVCRHVGVTTVTDLFAQLRVEDVEEFASLTDSPGFGVRIVPTLAAVGAQPEELARRALDLASRSTDKLRLGAIKIMTDGSIQGWTARVKWPGYIGGQRNGLWNSPPVEIYALCEAFQKHGIQMHIHANGDEASEVSLDALAAAARKHPWPGARHVLQHGQMMGEDQFRRSAELGVCVNLFANHIWYFGDQHVAHTIGESRAGRMNAARSALDAGVNVAIHSDAPITPIAPLFTAWCAVNRRTMSGRTLGPAQRITVDEALYAITLGAAYTLKLDDEIGSIEVGKVADFAILGDDPTAVDPMALKDVPVLGTMSGGHLALK